VLSVTSHVPVQFHTRQPTGTGTSRNGIFPANSTHKRSRLTSATPNATDQFEAGRTREIYNNQPPTSSSMHPSLPLPYVNGHNIHPVPGAEWAVNNNQLEGPGVPGARVDSHPMGVSVTAAPVSGAVDLQLDSGVGGDGEGDGDDNKTYCFCNSVSYGEMIACDENSCEREWVRFVFVLGFASRPETDGV
jgi:inhibitor of growth protein 3